MKIFSLTDFLVDGLVRTSKVKKQLDYAHSIAKRLDEHRELVETLEHDTSLLTEKPWIINHLATQDNYLMRIFHMVHSFYPEQAKQLLVKLSIRPRPAILGDVGISQFTS